MNNGQVRIFRHTSEWLKNNPLNDPFERNLVVYLPPGYDDDSQRRYPVIYLLSGYMGFGKMFLSPQAWGYSMDERCDKLIADGAMVPCIVVMPDCFTRYGGAQYMNSSALGNYEYYLIQEIIPFVDQQFRTMSDKFHRAVMGKSSGGYGALRLCMRNPDLFSACYAGSADMYFEYCYLPDIPKCYSTVNRLGGLSLFFKEFFSAPKKSNEMITAMNIIAMSAAYSPNPDHTPYGFDLPFDEATGELRQDIWKKWKHHDLVVMMNDVQYQQSLRNLKGLFMDCGSRDEFHLHVGARIFSRILHDCKIPHEYEEYNDGHMSTSYRYDTALVKISHVIQ